MKKAPVAGLIFSLAVFLVLGLLSAIYTPYGSFPDEESHLEYIQQIRVNHRLPNLSFQISQIATQEAFQPPLYYFLAASLFRQDDSNDTNLFRIRLFSLFLGALVIFLTWKSALLIFPDHVAACWIIPALAATNPQFIFSHAGVSNISMTSATCSWTAFLCALIAKSGRISIFSGAMLGAAMGLALLSRTITVFLIPVCMLSFLLCRKNMSWKSILLRGVLTWILVAFSICGWWYIRNWIYFEDPFLWKVHQTTVGALWARTEPVTLQYMATAIAFLHATFWVYFGRNEFHAGIWEYAVYLLIESIAILGIIEILRRTESSREFCEAHSFQRTPFLVFLFASLIALVEILLLQSKISSAQGRYLYMAMTPICVVLGSGLLKVLWTNERSQRAILFTALLLLFCLYLFARYWSPHYLGQ